eukprot:TRINITY_DN3140_c0_g1_i6.p1 TRINITY_DN3140_c0_g1~~TRINITY_DN3140_c0_g1_i6.p1  ORF type:complete len:352 (-),score=46.35 TRINITY_DN3140_c0_g1_i6:45-1100(-)
MPPPSYHPPSLWVASANTTRTLSAGHMSRVLSPPGPGALLDPSRGVAVIPPAHTGPGHWAGACSVTRDETTGSFYLYYRVRQPRPIRGGHCYIAESKDGLTYRTIWQATKEEIGTQSMEKSCLTKVADDMWHLYISYVDEATNMWRIDLIQAQHPSQFDVKKRIPVLSASMANAAGVKDPCVYMVGGTYHMYYTYASARSHATEDMHATGDAYNTDQIVAGTGLATSQDGITFEVADPVLVPALQTGPSDAWDRFCMRLCSIYCNGGVYHAFYDGSSSVEGNYEERTGLAVSTDLRSFARVPSRVPLLASPHASGCLRYMDVLEADGQRFFYYEYAREDGSHELRVKVQPL